MNARIRLAHIVFRTKDLPAMRDWYAAVLSADVVFANDQIAFLTFDEEHHRIALIAPETAPPRGPPDVVGFHHAAFTLESLPELLDRHDRLAAVGIIPWRTINHGVTTSLYYRDPDGNDIELQVDRFADPRDAQEWMQGEVFAANPVGLLVEVADLRRRLDEGEPLPSIFRRADEPAEPVG